MKKELSVALLVLLVVVGIIGFYFILIERGVLLAPGFELGKKFRLGQAQIECSDNIDNDGDGMTDTSDVGCWSGSIIPDSQTQVLFHLDNNALFGESNSFVHDYSGSGYHGTVFGDSFYNANGKIIGSFEFDGNGDYIAVGDMPPPSELTLAAWIYPTNIGGFQNIIGKNARYDGSDREYVLVMQEDILKFQVFGPAGEVDEISSSSELIQVVQNQWQHVAATWNGNEIKLFYNGQEIGPEPVSVGQLNDGTKGLAIAKISVEDDNEFFAGRIDEVGVWSRALSNGEISSLSVAAPISGGSDESGCGDGVCEGGETEGSCFADCNDLSPECSDNIDNDGDGLIDSADPGCWNDPQDEDTYNPNLNFESAATSQCQDGEDNDLDGLTDYPEDDGCYSEQDNSELGGGGAGVECSDGEDNDGDGDTDWPADFGCASPDDYLELYAGPLVTECNDGADNDGDGFFDLSDSGCDIEQDNDESNCGDNVCNGHETFYFCPGDCPSECSDNVDNDGDGFSDLGDAGCEDNNDNDESNCGDNVCEGGENFPFCSSDCNAECNDGLDNDGDGLFDLDDNHCNDAQDNTEFNTQVYNALKNNQRVKTAIELHRLTTPNNYQNILDQKINDLDTGNTGSWDNYRTDGNTPNQCLWTDDEVLQVYMQKVAVSLYTEAHDLVPWSFLDYSDEDLELLLSDDYSDDFEGAPQVEVVIEMYNNNQLLPFRYGNELLESNPGITTGQDLLDLIVLKMRDDNWLHKVQSWDDVCGMSMCFLPGNMQYFDFKCMEEAKVGTSSGTPRFIYAILQSYNVPSRDISLNVHNGARYPTLDLSIDGDVPYSQSATGWRLRPNYVPVEVSYIDGGNDDNPPDTCESASLYHRDLILGRLGTYNDLEWNKDLIETYCFTPSPGDEPGEWLKDSVGDIGVFCQNDDPDGDDYWPPPLTDQEWDQWYDLVAQYALC
jgi:hypothetical protein